MATPARVAHHGRMSPLIGLLADTHPGGLPSHSVKDKYVAAIRDGAEALPVLIPPPLDDADLDLAALLDRLDGLVLPGSTSNVAPEAYGQANAYPDLPGDAPRDRLALPLVREAVRRGMPVLAICRGFQELNVALGGTLHQAVHDVAGLTDHREDGAAPEAVRYAPAHSIRFEAGPIRAAAGDEARVNSLHGQGIDRLADGLAAEAYAPDGLVEAARGMGHGFVLGVQWHPEWRHGDTALGRYVFASFGDAARAWKARTS